MQCLYFCSAQIRLPEEELRNMIEVASTDSRCLQPTSKGGVAQPQLHLVDLESFLRIIAHATWF